MTALTCNETTFDYAALSDDIAAEARVAADRIRARLKRTAADVVEAGRDLLEMKERLGHGRFLAWIDAEFGMSQWSARNFMRAAECFGKSRKVPDLLIEILYKLASSPEPIRSQLIDRAEAGERITMQSIRGVVHPACRERARTGRTPESGGMEAA